MFDAKNCPFLLQETPCTACFVVNVTRISTYFESSQLVKTPCKLYQPVHVCIIVCLIVVLIDKKEKYSRGIIGVDVAVTEKTAAAIFFG